MRLGFQEKIYFMVCLLLVLGTSSMGVLNYLSSKKSATEMVHNKLEAVAQNRAELVAKIIEKELEAFSKFATLQAKTARWQGLSWMDAHNFSPVRSFPRGLMPAPVIGTLQAKGRAAWL